jgi:hypothetical protein
MAPVSSACTQVGQFLSCNLAEDKTKLFVNCIVKAHIQVELTPDVKEKC